MGEADSNTQEAKWKISKLAVGAFGLAIVGIVTVFVTAPFALILGILSVFRIQKSKGKLKGTSVAIAAIIIAEAGAIWLVYVGIPRMRSVNPRMICGSNLSALGKAMMVYANEYNNQYPTVDKWCDLLLEYTDVSEKQFRCPGNKEDRCSYAMNANCEPNSPPDTVLLFETKDGWNQYGGKEILTKRNHYGEGCNVLSNDYHCSFEKYPEKLNWGDEQQQ